MEQILTEVIGVGSGAITKIVGIEMADMTNKENTYLVQVKDGKKTVKEKVYFPGYVMIEANLVGEIPHIIKSITGVISFYSTNSLQSIYLNQILCTQANSLYLNIISRNRKITI